MEALFVFGCVSLVGIYIASVVLCFAVNDIKSSLKEISEKLDK